MNIFEIDEKLFSSNTEIVKTIEQNRVFKIEIINSFGHTSDWYNQEENEIVCLLDGEAVIEYESEDSVRLKKGDMIKIAPHVKHRVSYTSAFPPCIWLCIFYNDI